MKIKGNSFLVYWFLVQLCLVSTALTNLNVTQTDTGWSVRLVEDVRTRIKIDLGHGNTLQPESCGAADGRCFRSLQYGAQLTVRQVEAGPGTCVEIDWQNPDSRQADCVVLGEDRWYGGAEVKVQRWPIQGMDLKRSPYVTGDFGRGPLGGILDGLWISSGGAAVFVDRDTPLFLSFNQSGDGKMCFSASYDEYPYSGVDPAKRASKVLRYTACSTADVLEAFRLSRRFWIRRPTATVDPSVVERPIWSTWARMKKSINQEKVLDFAKDIVVHGFDGSHLEIDDKWEICYGQMDFDLWRFPDASRMVAQIKSLGFNVSLWVHPYASVLCPSFYDPEHRRHLIRKETSGRPLVCLWWNGMAGYLDVTDPAARDYLVDRLDRVKNSTGVDTFKFDSGEVGYIANGFALHDRDLSGKPNAFTRLYVETAARLGPGVEVRVAYDSQHLPVFVRMLDKDSRWDTDNGLQTLIPTALLMSTLGYPYVLPDMVGGNGYSGSPGRELFVRWLQVSTFMPALQFSVAPWDYDDEVVNISLAMVELHRQHSSLINELAAAAVLNGEPIVRPLWWAAPHDPQAWDAEQEFLLGDQILVAPVVDEGATARDVYLPAGRWQDQISPGLVHEGPVLLQNYGAQLDQLPFFVREN